MASLSRGGGAPILTIHHGNDVDGVAVEGLRRTHGSMGGGARMALVLEGVAVEGGFVDGVAVLVVAVEGGFVDGLAVLPCALTACITFLLPT